jgi:hypothetical protein
VKSLPDYFAFGRPNSSEKIPSRATNSGFEVVVVSIMFGTFFALLKFGMMILVRWVSTDPQQAENCGIMCFDKNGLLLLMGIGIALEGAAGGFLASLFLLSILEKKPLGRVMGLTFLIHSIAILALGIFLEVTENTGICGMSAFIGGSFAITCTLIAWRTQDMLTVPPEASGP